MALKALVIFGAIAAYAWHEIRLAKRDQDSDRREDGSESENRAPD